MFIPASLRDIPPRLALLRAALLGACLITMLASAPLWQNTRAYPLLPVSSRFLPLTAPWGFCFFALVLIALGVAAWRYRLGVTAFLVSSFLLALADQSRWQPWFYMYWVMLLFTLAKDSTAIAACRVALCAVYFWSGLQKCNPDFFNLVAPWFVKPAGEWLPGGVLDVLRWLVMAAPLIEIFIGIGLWLPRTRCIAIGASLLIHASALLFLGPAGHGHNWIIWPWNLVMPALVIVLFPRAPFGETWSALRQSRWAAVVLGLFCLLPTLSYFGKWDSYLSFSLYTGHLTKADIFISAAVRDRLPAEVQPFVVPTPQPYNEQVQGPYVVLVELWADKVLKVPPLPEARNYRNVARYLARFADDPNDVRMVLIPRVGKMLFHRGGDLRPEAGIPLNLD